jgi:hypothetical protein
VGGISRLCSGLSPRLASYITWDVRRAEARNARSRLFGAELRALSA